MGLLKLVKGEERAVSSGYGIDTVPAGWHVPFSGMAAQALPDVTTNINVDQVNGMAFVPVFACARLISQDVGMLPLKTYRTVKGIPKRTDNPPWIDQPNVDMGTLEFVEQVVSSLCLWGNAYILPLRDPDTGTILELWPLDPAGISVWRDFDTQRLLYTFRGNPIDADELLHIRAFHGPNTYLGLSPIAIGRAAISVGMAMDQFAGAIWANGGHLEGVIETSLSPGKDDEALTRLGRAWKQRHAGPKNGRKTAILTDGATYKAIGVPLADGSFIAAREFQVEEVCRLYGVPPHMVWDLSKATNNNIEQQDIDYRDHTLMGYIIRVERALSELLPPRVNVKFDVKNLMRLDPVAQANYFKTLWYIGAIMGSEIREELDFVPLDDPALYQLYRPVNTVPLGFAGASVTAPVPIPAVPPINDPSDPAVDPQPADLGPFVDPLDDDDDSQQGAA